MPTLPFLHGLLMFGWTMRMFLPNLTSVASPVPETMAIEVLGGDANPQSWGTGGRRRSGMVQALHSHFSSIFTRFRDIAGFVLHQLATFFHPTSSLPKIFQCFPRTGGWSLGYEERRCWADCPTQLVSKIFNLCSPDQRHSETDRRTDGRHSIAILRNSASRGIPDY